MYNMPFNPNMSPNYQNNYLGVNDKILELDKKIEDLTKRIEKLEQSMYNNYNNGYNINKDSGIYMI